MIFPRTAFVVWFFAALGIEAQPSNDLCSAAISLVINGPEVTGSTVDATVATTSGCGVTKQAPEVWYTVTGNGRKMTATTCADQTDFATGLTLWSRLCSTCNTGSFTDPDCPDALGARVTWDSVNGQQYTLLVYGRQAGSTGQFGISVTDFPSPVNDYCEQAQSLAVNGGIVLGSTINATTRTTSGCGVTKQAPEVWYTVTGNGRKMTATTCADQTDFETGLTLWSRLCSTCNTGSFTDPDCPNALGARVTWDSGNGQQYTLLVYGRQAGSTGQFGISVTDFPNPANDYCEQAQSLAVNGGIVLGSTINATTRTTSGCGVTKQAPEVWYTVTGNGRKMTATTCADQTDFATGLTLWSRLCSTCNTGSFTDPDCPNALGARVTWDSGNGQQYTLLVYGRQAGSTGQFGISVTDFVNPSNDYCEQATPLLPNGVEVLGSTINATTRTTSGCGVTKQAPEVWYSVTGNGKNLTATTCSSNTNFETGLTLWSRLCSTCNTGSFIDNDCDSVNGAAVKWQSVADQVYTLLVYGRQAASTGNFGITVFDTDNPPAPSSPTTSPPISTPPTTTMPAPTPLPTESPQAPPTDAATDPPTTAVPPTESPQAPPTDAATDPPTTAVPPPPMPCINVTVDFSEDANGSPLQGGTYVDNEWEAFGLVLSSSGGLGLRPRLFNSSDVGDDADLGSPHKLCTPPGPGMGSGGRPGSKGENCVALGNVLIIQEDNENPAIPDDNVGGGTIVFDFVDEAAFFYEIGFLDVDTKMSVTVVHGLGLEETVVDLPSLGNNAAHKESFEIENVEQVRVDLSASGAVTFLSFCYNP